MKKSQHTGRAMLAVAFTLAWATAQATAPPATAAEATRHHDSPKPRHPDAASIKATPVGQVWDWSKIDTNKDDLIEPAEMEAWLKANPRSKDGA